MIDYPKWYWIAAVKFHIRNYTYRRETVFMPKNFKDVEKEGKTTRMIKIHNVQHLDIWLKNMHISDHKKNFNLYYSLAKYKDGIPHGSLNLAERDFGDWNQEHWKEMITYDFMIDIDAGNFKEMDFAYYSAGQVKRLFDKLNVAYHLRFSGMGFHFIIPYVYFSTHQFSFNDNFNPDDEDNIYNFYRKIAMELHSRFSEMIDVNIYDSRRVIKIPYSLALHSNKNYVCYPFNSDKKFNEFNLEAMRPYVIFNELDDKPEHLFNLNGNVFKLLKELELME